MANLRALVKRRKAVRNIRKITKTMELIATSRFQRASKRATDAEAFTRKIAEMAADLAQERRRRVSHPLLVTRPVKKSLLLVITANRGLCGGYNGSILREAMRAVRQYRGREHAVRPGSRPASAASPSSSSRASPGRRSTRNFEDKPTFAEVDRARQRGSSSCSSPGRSTR